MAQDLVITLVGAFGIFFMGILVYFHDRGSVTNRAFFMMSLSAVFWSLANYFSINVGQENVLIWVRLVLFSAAPLMATFFLFIYNFPDRNIKMSRLTLALFLTVTALVMIATISQFVFSDYRIDQGNVVPIAGPAMPIFAFLVFGCMGISVIMMTKKYIDARDVERKQWRVMVVGVFSTFALLILTNYILVIVFGITFFIKFGPLFILPAVFGMGYAILRHQLLNVKAIATEILTFSILSISLFEVFASDSFWELIFRIVLFCLFFLFGILLIRSVLKEVEQREKLEILSKQLGDANEKLKELDHLKSEFLSFASHQLKAPLAAVKGFASLIIDGSYGEVSDKVRDAAIKIKDSADRMVQLVTDALNIRKIEEGRMDYKFERTNIIKTVQNIFEELRPLAENKNLDFRIDSYPGEGWINADVQNIRQVFQNLIENSIKYTESGFVKVKTEISEGFFLFSVADSGHGISKDVLPHLFEEFKREASVRKIEGTGLGLFIAHEIAIAHKGEIGAESDGPGKGSKFTVKIPLA